MHWTPHSSLGAATIAFYSPALIASICLLYIHGPPRMTWVFLCLMTAIRIASGILVILYESGGHYHTDLSTSTRIMLSVGIFPLVFAMVGWVYIFIDIDPSQNRKRLTLVLMSIRVVGIVALAFIIAGSILLGPIATATSGRSAGEVLVKVGVFQVIVILATTIMILIALWVELVRRKIRSRTLYAVSTSVIRMISLSLTENQILTILSLSTVLLILRVVYMCLNIFHGGADSIWNPLYGSIDMLVRLSLLPEYVIVVVMLVTGFWMLKMRKVEKLAVDEAEN